MLPQRLATGATGVKQARYRRGSEALVRACAVYKSRMCVPWHLLFKCETMHGVMPAYEFCRGFCTLVLFIITLWANKKSLKLV